MNPLHDSEQVVGRITRKRQWDRRYKIRQAEPVPVKFDRHDLFELLGGMLVLGLCIVGLIMWAAIFAVMP